MKMKAACGLPAFLRIPLFILAALALAFASCRKATPTVDAKPGKPAAVTLAKVTFQVDDPEDKADGPSPYVHLADPKKDLERMRKPQEVVYKGTELTVILEYPFSKEFEFPIRASSPDGFRRAELAEKIAALYKQVYEEEARTSKVPVIPPDQRKGLINRNQTAGKYGIWGHDLEDLVLHEIEISRMPDGTVRADLGIDS
jgi:hypothetical protein